MSDAVAWTSQVLSSLHRKGRERRGVIRAAERSIGVADGYFRKRRAIGSMELSKLMGMLEAMELHPARFFRQAFPERNGVRSLIDPPKGKRPEIVSRAEARRGQNVRPTIFRDHLHQLDSLKYADPEKAARATENALDFVNESDVPLLLGVWASAQRLLIELDPATHAIWYACSLARELGQEQVYGDLLQRLAFVVADKGSYETAHAVSQEATDVWLTVGDLAGVGRSLVDRGIWSYHLGRVAIAERFSRQALAHLPADDFRNRCAALQILGTCARDADDLPRAEEYLAEALGLAGALEPLGMGKLRWFEALVKADSGKSAEAVEILSAVVELFRPIHRGEAALVAVDLVRLLLENGRRAEALSAVQAIVPLLSRHASRNAIVRAAETTLVELIRGGSAGLTLHHVEVLQGALERIQRERHLWRSLEVT